MLVVLAGAPGTAPGEVVAGEEAVAEVVAGDLVGEGAGAVGVGTAGRGVDDEGAVAATEAMGVVEGIDIDSEAEGVLGEPLAAGNGAVAEAGAVVGAHLAFVVGIEDVGQEHTLDGVAGLVELTENVGNGGGDALVADHLADADMAVAVDVQGADMAQVGAADVGIGAEGLALHAGPYVVGNGLCEEAAVEPSEGGNGVLGDDGSSLPRVQGFQGFLAAGGWGEGEKKECENFIS